MNPQNLTYEVSWRCTHCKASGVVSISTNEACDTLFRHVVEEHAALSTDCAAIKQTSGLALQPPSGQEKLN